MTSCEDEKRVQEECEELWSQLKDLRAQLEERHLEGEQVQKETALGEIYRQKHKALEAQLKLLKETPVKLPDLSEGTQIKMLIEKLERNVGEMQETLLFVKEQRHQTDQEVKFLKTRVLQEEKIRDVLQDKLTEASAVGEESEDEVLHQLKKDCGSAETRRKQLIKDMKAFVNEHFPVHDDHSLIDMLQLLMNRCVESPHAPYVESEGAWQPYVEMLLRTGIVLAHKENDQLIRLNPFHLRDT